MDIQPRAKRNSFSLRAKLILGFSLISAFASFMTARGIYTNLQKQVTEEFKTRAASIIQVASLQQNGDEFIRISSDQDPLYEKFRLQNLKIRQSDSDIKSVFTLRKDEKGIYFVVDAGEIGEKNISAFNKRYSDATTTLVNNFNDMDRAIVEPQISTNQNGSFLSAYAPIFSADGSRAGVIGIDIRADSIIQKQKEILFQSIIIFMVALGLCVFFGYVAGNALTEPIIKLAQGALDFSSGNLDRRVDINTGDEIEAMAHTFNTMAGEIQRLINSLELRVEERASKLVIANDKIERRAAQFESLAQVARAISSTKNSDILLSQIVTTISREFGFYHVGIFLLDTRKEYAVLSATNSEGGQKMLARGHRLKVGETGIVGFVTGAGKARVALDTGADAIFFNNPDLPNTSSEIALPLLSGEEVIGALDVQSTERNAFTQEDISILSILSDQVSIAIQNARQFEETQKALAESESLSRQFVQSGWRQFTKSQNILGIHHTGAKSTLFYRKNGNSKDKNSFAKEQSGVKQRGTSLSLPLKLRGEVIGKVVIRSTDNRQWGQDELDIVLAIIERSAFAMENARLLSSSQKLAAKERTIGEISAKISAQSEIDELLKTAARELSRTLPGAEIAIQFKEDQES